MKISEIGIHDSLSDDQKNKIGLLNVFTLIASIVFLISGITNLNVNDFDLKELTTLLSNAPGVIVQQDDASQLYPMPLWAHDKDDVFVGRLRRDETQAKTLNMWIVSDNLRKGAATNAVQIAEYLVSKGII